MFWESNIVKRPFFGAVQTPHFFDILAKSTMFGRWSWFFVWMFRFGDPNLGVAGNQGVVRNEGDWDWCRCVDQEGKNVVGKKEPTQTQDC